MNLIIDIGSESIKYIDKNKDYSFIFNCIGIHNNTNKHISDFTFSNLDENMEIFYPLIENEEIKFKENIEEIIDFLFEKIEIKNEINETNLIILNNTRNNELYELFFKKYNIPNMCIWNSSLGSLYSSGLTSALVWDLGFEKSRLTPFFESYLIKEFYKETIIGGYYIDIYSKNLIQFKNLQLNNLEVIELKKNYNKIKINIENNKKFVLPDNNPINLDEIFGELLFDPNLFNLDALSINDIVSESLSSIKENNIFLMENLNNLIITGGLSKFENIDLRLKIELDKNINIIKLDKGIYNNLNGISNIIELPSLTDYYIQISEYQEHGVNIFDKKLNNFDIKEDIN